MRLWQKTNRIRPQCFLRYLRLGTTPFYLYFAYFASLTALLNIIYKLYIFYNQATCSNACHHNLIEAQQKCHFHQNFTVHTAEKSMRSIQLRTIYHLYDQGFAQGTPVNRTS
jgi:hypothetical protein